MTCWTPVLGKRIRVIQLDGCGNLPATGAGGTDKVAVSDGFISVQLSAQVEDGAEIITKKADGSLCVNEMLSSSFKRFTLEIEFCGVDPGLLSVVSNAEVYEDYATDPAGFVVPEGKMDKKFSFELWTGLSGEACAPGVQEASAMMVLPFVEGGVLGDLTVDGENAVSFTMTGAFTRGGNQWGKGPYKTVLNGSNVAAVLPTALDPLDHLLMVKTGVAPPASACGLQDYAPA